jgi:2-polyprenyl-6-methoxyphenol hydroxylase-like FAD-dependent oxidoreductase
VKVLIAGAGIAGPATAIALHKAGIAASVCEAYPGDAPGTGAFLTLSANGQDALRAIDVYGPVAAVSFAATRMQILDHDGNQLADLPLGANYPGPRTITRSQLSQTLRQEAAARGIPVEYGKRLTAAASSEAGIRAEFSNGSHADADVLIGADGIHSPARTIIDPNAPAPRYTGLMIACGYADAGAGDADEGSYHMIRGSRAYFGYTRGPADRAWWFARVPGPELTAADQAAPASHWRDRLAETFTDDNTPAAAIIRATHDPITVTSAYDIPALPAWHNESMVVIGDAAHATSPSTAQGASQALEDAAILAQCLRDIPAVPKALATFERLRRDRVERIVAAGMNSGNTPPSNRQQDQPRKANPPEWLYSHHIDWAQTLCP